MLSFVGGLFDQWNRTIVMNIANWCHMILQIPLHMNEKVLMQAVKFCWSGDNNAK
jgi:hypothetical protein